MSPTTPLLAEHRAHGGASETLGADKKLEEDCGSNSSAGLAKAKKPVEGVYSDADASASSADSKKPGAEAKKPDQTGSSEESSSPEDSKKKPTPSVGKKLNSKKNAAPSVGKKLNVNMLLGLVTEHTPDAEDVQDILEATDAVLANHFLPASVLTAYDNDRKTAEPNLLRLRVQARNFCDLAAASSMAEAAVEFNRAVEKHAAGKDRGKKAAETGLQKSGISLFHAANDAPPIEKALADIALKLTEDSDTILLTSDEIALKSTARGPLNFLTEIWGSGRCLECDRLSGSCRCCSGCWPSMLKWIRSGPELTLPVHHKRQAKLAGKRQVLYAIALGTPLALLTSAASLNIFPSEYATWIAGATVFMWVVVSGGMMVNQYGTTHLELMVAINLSRLGMVGVCVLLCVYAFWAFFPSNLYVVWILLAFAVLFHGVLCYVSRVRGDDDIVSLIQIAEKLESITTNTSSG